MFRNIYLERHLEEWITLRYSTKATIHVGSFFFAFWCCQTYLSLFWCSETTHFKLMLYCKQPFNYSNSAVFAGSVMPSRYNLSVTKYHKVAKRWFCEGLAVCCLPKTSWQYRVASDQRFRPPRNDVLMKICGWMSYRIVGYKFIKPFRDNTCQIDCGYMCIWTECQTKSTFLISNSYMKYANCLQNFAFAIKS